MKIAKVKSGYKLSIYPGKELPQNLDKIFGTAIWEFIEFVEVLNVESELGALIAETQADRFKKLEREPRSVVNEICNVSVGGSAIDITPGSGVQ